MATSQTGRGGCRSCIRVFLSEPHLRRHVFVIYIAAGALSKRAALGHFGASELEKAIFEGVLDLSMDVQVRL